MKKRILGIVLAIAMIAALLPTFTLTATAKPGDFFIRTSDVDRSLEGRTPGLVVTADQAETPVSTSYTSGEVTIEELSPATRWHTA